jgi:hypothetical protein
MVLKVRAGVPLVWRSPSSLQFGVDAPLAVLEELDSGTERIVAALVSGISRSGFDMMARSLGLTTEASTELLARLDPVLEFEGGAAAHPNRAVVDGIGPLAGELRRLLAERGVLADPGERAPGLAVIVAGWLVAAEDHGTWLRRDIPHLPVVIGDSGVTIGPFVDPGSGPCLYCVQLTMTDEDAAWPAIATQLWSRAAPELGELPLVEAAAFAARRIAERLSTGPAATLGAATTSWRLDAATGELSSRGWTRHAECRCAAPAESDWAPVPDRATRPATRRAEVAAVPA